MSGILIDCGNAVDVIYLISRDQVRFKKNTMRQIVKNTYDALTHVMFSYPTSEQLPE